jgi:hypothetical protein
MDIALKTMKQMVTAGKASNFTHFSEFILKFDGGSMLKWNPFFDYGIL